MERCRGEKLGEEKMLKQLISQLDDEWIAFLYILGFIGLLMATMGIVLLRFCWIQVT